MKAVLRATFVISSLGIVSRVLGAVRQAVFANHLGAGEEVDIYVAAFRFPDLVFNFLILGTLSAAFIPIFVSYLQLNRGEALQIASTVFNLTAIVMGVVVIVGIVASPILVSAIVPGFSELAKTHTADLTRILMLSPLLFSLSSVLTSVLHSFKRFLVAATAPIFYNLSIIAGVLFFYPKMGLKGLAWAVVLGAFLHLMVQFPQVLKLGFRPALRLGLGNPALRKIGQLFLPRLFGIELGQISLLVASVIGSFQASGSLAIFYFAYDLETVAVGVLAVPFAIVAFPTMSDIFGKGDIARFRKFFSETVVQILYLVIPVSVLILLLRAQIVRLIYGAGQNTHFTFADTRLTAEALGFFALSLFAQSLVPLLARGFYAMQNTVVPVLSGAMAAILNVGLAIIFARFAGANFMALAFSIAISIHMLIMLFLLHRRLGGLNNEEVIVRLIKISIASMGMGIATFLTLYTVAPLVNMQTYLGVAIQTVSALFVALATYLTVGFLIQLPETRAVLRVLKNWLTKFSGSVG